MADRRINLAALQQRDPYILEVIDNASQVALYSYNSDTESWEKTSIEGSLFVYRRSADPIHGFMILNKLGLNNLIEPITHDLEFQQQNPFLLYRNSKNIYGIWFYEKDDCKRVGGRLNGYVEEIERAAKEESGARMAQGGADRGAGGMSATSSQSQVDIMQMLSKAQLEYNTGTTGTTGNKKKTEPKPMIDNPNASATKKSDLIRPRPLKMPDQDAGTEERSVGSTTPGTAPISLDALFRTASLQQAGSAPKFQANVSNNAIDFSRDPTKRGHAAASDPVSGGQEKDRLSKTDEYPPLLRHIMSTGSMVEDIEKQQVDTSMPPPPAQVNKGQYRHKPDDHSMPMVMPDFSQPPPGHPAYRGPSPKTQTQQRTSPREPISEPRDKNSSTQVGTRSEDTSKRKFDLKVDVGLFPSQSSSVGKPGLLPEAQAMPDRLLPQYGNVSPSQTRSGGGQTKFDRQTSVTDRFDKQPSPGVDTLEPPDTPRKLSEPLLTPADLMQSASSMWSSGLAANQQQTKASQERSMFPPHQREDTKETVKTGMPQGSQSPMPSLAAAAQSLASVELLPPSAFTTAKKPSPVTTAAEQGSTSNGRDTDPLPMAALTKEQLQQALLHIIKNDDNFITTLHEAYLQSLKDLSGHKA